MVQELDQIVLTSDLPKYRLKAGDLGTVVQTFDAGDVVIVEFFTANGKTLAVTSVPTSQVRLVGEMEVLGARPLE